MIFFTQNEEKFYLVVNGVQQNNKPSSNVKISGMAAPMQYNIRIKFEKDNIVINDKVSLLPNTEKTWIIQPKNGNYVIKFSGQIEIGNEMQDKPFVSGEQEEIIYNPQVNMSANQDGFSMNMNTGEESVNISMDASGMNSNVKTNSTSSNTAYSKHQYAYKENVDRPINRDCNNPINSMDFKNELHRVNTQTSNAGKKLVAEKIAKAFCLTSKQVYLLCNELTFSNDKLELAKLCYTHCYDPENYEEVYKCFSISATVKELDDYINSLGTIHNTHNPHHQSHPTIVEEEYVPGYSGPRGCSRPMSVANFNDAKNTIAQANFEETKKSTAKTILASNCVTTSQVIELCRMFDFEATKLEFAKFAYSKTYDKANYYKVNVVFDFDASKEDLNRFIQKGGR